MAARLTDEIRKIEPVQAEALQPMLVGLISLICKSVGDLGSKFGNVSVKCGRIFLGDERGTEDNALVANAACRPRDDFPHFFTRLVAPTTPIGGTRRHARRLFDQLESLKLSWAA